MRKEEVINRLCSLITEVGDATGNTHSTDCFCGFTTPSGETVSDEIIHFIEQTVRDALKVHRRIDVLSGYGE
jgi:hypothetical protein